MTIKTKIRISLIILIVAVFSLLFLLIYPFFKDIKKSSVNILEQKQKLLLLELKIGNLEKFRNRYREIEPDLKSTETFFVKADLPIDFIRFLEKTAKDSDVNAKISLSSGVYSIAAIGSSPNFLRFLERLQYNQYLVSLQNVTVSREKDGLSASISFSVLTK